MRRFSSFSHFTTWLHRAWPVHVSLRHSPNLLSSSTKVHRTESIIAWLNAMLRERTSSLEEARYQTTHRLSRHNAFDRVSPTLSLRRCVGLESSRTIDSQALFFLIGGIAFLFCSQPRGILNIAFVIASYFAGRRARPGVSTKIKFDRNWLINRHTKSSFDSHKNEVTRRA